MAKKQKVRQSTSIKARIHHHVKLAVVPHKANQYRPHLIRRYAIIALLVLIASAQVLYNGVTSGNILGTHAEITSAGLLSATNSARIDAHETPLVLNADLSKAAQMKVQDMFTHQYWAHISPDGTTPWHWFNEAGYSYAEAGENLAKNFTTSKSAVAAWLASPSHRANVLEGGYKDVGFAVMDGTLNGTPTTLVVALYATPESAAIKGALVNTQTSTLNPPISVMGRIGTGIASLNPVALASIVVLLLVANVALIAHLYRRKLPLTLRRSWYRHHGIYKAIGFTSLAVIMIVAYGTIGQI